MKVYLDTIGCRLNQAEIELYARQFRAAGHTLVAAPDEADLAVVNTCTVTAAAASDSRQKIRQIARAGAGEVVVTGCWSTLKPEEAAALPSVSRVISNSQKDGLVPDLLQIELEGFDLEPVEREPIPGARLRTRAFIKVQDGCDNRCTFCITTVARGPGRSRSIEEVLADIHAALQDDVSAEGSYDAGGLAAGSFAAGGLATGSSDAGGSAAREIVLTGVHLGSWGQDFSPALHLRDLIQAILQETDTPRLRLSSLEPWDLDADFFALWEDGRLCRHLHLPLQSGCAATLRRMARKTSPQSFSALMQAARSAIPDIAITTDVITGFPGESQAEFSESLDFVKAMRFAGGHVFTYSPRPGTAAARMPNQVPVKLRKDRNAQMRAALAESEAVYRKQFLGEVLPVLWESASAFGPQGWNLSGLTDNYLRVNARAPRQFWNQITRVRLTGVDHGRLKGEIVEFPQGSAAG
jgi:threonylcarbamoyladenosine tRNA methylthiotransferase MtaB